MKRLIIVLFALTFCTGSKAETTDSLDAVKIFIDVCKGYRKTPMHAIINYSTNTNYLTESADTSNIQGDFYILDNKAYMRFGEMEQLVNDSVALIVSNSLKRMILFTNVHAVIQQMNAMTGMHVSDSSVSKIIRNYKASVNDHQDHTKIVELTSRQELYGAALPKETVAVTYNEKNKQPISVVTTKRSLVPIDSTTAELLAQDKKMISKVIVADDRWFVIKENVSVFDYVLIEYSHVKLPVDINERLVRNSKGNYVPVEKYSMYMVSKGN